MVLLLGFLELVDQMGGGEEAYAFAVAARGEAQGDGDVRFARAGIANQTGVAVFVDPLVTRQLQHLLLVERGRRGEVEAVQVLDAGEAGLFDPRPQRVGVPSGDFQFRQTQQILFVALVGRGGLAGQLLALTAHGGQAQFLEIRLEQQWFVGVGRGGHGNGLLKQEVG